MSIRDVYIAYTSIQKRRYEDLKLIAKFLGVEIKDNNQQTDSVDYAKLEQLAQQTLMGRGYTRHGISHQVKSGLKRR